MADITKNPTTIGGLERTLPSSWYLDQQIFSLEREKIFMQEWICVGREEEVPEPGNHKVLNLYGESILLVRNGQGQLRAHYNVCRHRGARLCPAGVEEDSKDRLPLKGGVVGKRNIVCPYHAWRYDLDGQLVNAPHMTQEMGLQLADVQLYPAACEIWGGFVFVNLSPDRAPPFAEHIVATADRFKRYPLAELRIAKTISYQVNANWKVLCENYNECYHCGPVHPELCRIVPAFREAGSAGLDWEQGVPHRDGAHTFTASGTTTRRAFPGLDQNERVNHKGDLVYPNLFLSLAADHVAVFILQARGPAETGIDCHFLFEPHEIEKADFDPADAVDFWHLVNRQDWSICERVQQGMGARVHEYGVYSPMEDWNLDIRKYVSERISPYLP
ncbi:MAG: aromatic ring-hydroxylating dioxygenase subunit alpha [Gammaproteobacteria bacterium]|nr:aromatic ring-hydroxylating dioxygenase subunit alpha [Gammaproteobacteria bacterium]